jgi:ferric-dicitrate binding protein FerR (iron transport regulator)
MEITELLIQKFCDYKCTVDEAEAVSVYFAGNPALLEKYFEEEWLETGNGYLTTKEYLSAEEYRELLQAIQQHVDQKRNDLKWIRTAVAVAASLLLIIMTGWLFTYQKQSHAYSHGLPKAEGNYHWQMKMNTTDKEMKVLLEDGSVVRLQAGSVLKYCQSFEGLTARDIYLSGNAFFKVAKDKTKPFTVKANGITVTALGTKFWVYAKDNKKLTVDLLEGKVVIKDVTENELHINDVYLTANQQFAINKLTNQYAVTDIVATIKNKIEKNAPINATVKSIKESLIFTDEPLENVLIKIQNKYKQPISFNKQDMKGLTFTGSILESDNLQVALSVICNMNDLVFNTEKGIIIITKK